MKSKLFVMFLFIVILLSSGCYHFRVIDETEVGLHLTDGISVDQTRGPGRYNDGGVYSKLVEIDISNKTGVWTDPDVATRDKQQIGVEIGITYRRGPDPESVIAMYSTYRREATNDEALWQQVQNRIARVLKNITTRYSLDQLLGVAGDDTSRAMIAEIFVQELGDELADVGVSVVDAGFNNITPSEQYRKLLEQKTAAAAAVEIAAQNTRKAEEELKEEQAKTQIALEIADRARQVAEKENAIYESSPTALRLRLAQIQAEALGNSSKMIIVPQGTDLSLLLGGSAIPLE